MPPKRTSAAACLAATALAATLVPASGGAANAVPEPSAVGSREAAAAQDPVATTPGRTKKERRRIEADRLRRRLVLVAKAKKRTGRYAYGAAGPNAFDCSGFTQWLYRTVVGRKLSHYSVAQMRQTRRVRKRDLRPGDLLFWGPGGSQHVSMYIGRGRMIGANNPRSGIRIESINAPWWRNKYAGAGRVIMA